MFESLDRPVGHRAAVTAVRQANRADSVFERAFDRELHGPVRPNLAHAVVSVDGGPRDWAFRTPDVLGQRGDLRGGGDRKSVV